MKLFATAAALFLLVEPALALNKPYPEPREGGSATYEVPVTDDLKPFATFSINDIRSTDTNGRVEIRDTLPMQLTGIKNEIVLTSTAHTTNGTYTNFSGPNGEANCNESACNVVYKNIKLDGAAVRQNFIAQGIGGLGLDKRMNVFASFSGDPAGIFRFK